MNQRRPMRFKVGDRVGYRDDPDDCGEIVALVEDTPLGTRWRIRWDSHPEGNMAERVLVPHPNDELASAT